MSLQNQFRVRLPCPVGADPGSLDTTNALTGRAAAMWSGNPLRVECGLLDASGTTVLTDFANLAGMVCSVWASREAGSQLLAQQSLTLGEINTALEQTHWDDGTDEHAVFIFRGADLNFDLGKAVQKSYWLTVQYLPADNSEPVTVWAGALAVYQDRAPGDSVPPDPVDQFMTRGEALATFTQLANPPLQAGFNLPDVGIDPSEQTIYAVRLFNGVLEVADEPGGTAGFINVARLACYDLGKAKNSIGRLFHGKLEWSD